MKEYQKPEMSVKVIVADTDIANSNETVISGPSLGDGWFEWDE